MGKAYKIKVTKGLLKQLRPFWLELERAQDRYHVKIAKIEKKMAKETGIKNIEFFFCDGGIAGIGNAERTMPLIPDTELERNRNKQKPGRNKTSLTPAQ